MEKQSRDKLSQILRQWLQLTTEALLSRNGVPGSRQASMLGAAMTAQALMNTANDVKKALACCDANVGGGHICGWLAAVL